MHTRFAWRVAPPAAVFALLLPACTDLEPVPETSSASYELGGGYRFPACSAAGHGHNNDPVFVERCGAQPGDLIDVALHELHPTQPSLGYDEVFYKLGRYTHGKDAINKKFDDWCEANGQVKAASAGPGARLDDPGSFTCTVAVGAETPDSIAPMKTVVIGPHAELYLTDGHHTFTSFWETPDGGPDLHVRVRVQGNLSHHGQGQFWQQMEQNEWTWLFDANDQPISPCQLPPSLGLAWFENDPYRGVIYFARDIGYAQLPGNAVFQEFYWGRWLRASADPALDLDAYDLDDLASYLALVKAVSKAQAALADDAVVSDGKTALELGKLPVWNAGESASKGEFGKLSKPYADAKPGKLAYLLEYK